MDTFLISPDLVYDVSAPRSSVASIDEAVALLQQNKTVVINSLEMAEPILVGLGYTEELAKFRIDYAVNGCAVDECVI